MVEALGGRIMQKKRIAVSGKRQITIPIDFFNKMGIENEVECYIQNNALIIKPIEENSGEFDENILADLIDKGYEGNELLKQFKAARKQVRPAIEKMLDEAKIAAGKPESAYSYNDIFGSEE